MIISSNNEVNLKCKRSNGTLVPLLSGSADKSQSVHKNNDNLVAIIKKVFKEDLLHFVRH